MSDIALGTLELTVLLAVARLGDDAYGLAVRRDVSARTGRDYSVGAMYTTLQRLEEKGVVRSRSSEPTPRRGGRTRRHFEVTSSGARAIARAERTAMLVWSGVGKTLLPEGA